MRTTAAPPACTIVPPYLLERIRQEGGPRAAAAAGQTLALDLRARAHREVRAARRGGGGDGTPTPGGFVPLGLQEKVQRRPVPGAAEVPATAAPDRAVHDAAHATTLPGALVRDEGGAPTADQAVTDAFDHLGATWQLYWQAYGRDSLDGLGLPLVASVHYGATTTTPSGTARRWCSATATALFFNRFTASVDVIGHELTHGVTQYTAGPDLPGQSGALNESVSDVFGSLVKQLHARPERRRRPTG